MILFNYNAEQTCPKGLTSNFSDSGLGNLSNLYLLISEWFVSNGQNKQMTVIIDIDKLRFNDANPKPISTGLSGLVESKFRVCQ